VTNYSQKKVDMLRNAIVSIQKNGSSDNGKDELSYNSLGTKIERSYLKFKNAPWKLQKPENINLPDEIFVSASPNGNRLDKLRKFATGKQRSMDDLHLFSLLIFLTDDETKYSSFDIEAFNAGDDDLTLPSLLAKVLSPIGSSSIYYHKLAGKYVGERIINDIHSIYTLNLEKTVNPCVLKCKLKETEDGLTIDYSGWSIFTEHDSLILFLKSEDEVAPRVLISNSCMTEFYSDNAEVNHAFICSDFDEMEEIDGFWGTFAQLNSWLNENSSLSKDAMIKFIKS